MFKQIIKKQLALFFLITSWMPVTSYALDLTKENITCMIKGAYKIGQDGKIIALEKDSTRIWDAIRSVLGIEIHSSFASAAIDTPLSINRRTGVYSNLRVNNDRWKIYVLDSGSDKQALKIVSTSTGGHVHAQYLQVDLYVDSPKKPLRVVDLSNIYTGYCE